jgi:hypothetical protein
MTNNLIICTGWGYKTDLVAIFVESWKKYMPEVNMIMLVEPDVKQDKLNYLLESGVDVRFYTAGYFVPSAIHNTRYFKYLDILLEERGQYDRVFHCDVRDVAFQGNIFDEIPAPADGSADLFVNEEDKRANLTERFNKYILTSNYGEAVAKELENERILCSGTTLGSQEMMISYIVTLMNQRDIKKMMEVGGIPDEQGPYNYLFHKNLIPHTKLENGVGVGTLCLCPPDDLKILADGRVSVYGKIPSVIHQWDRHNAIPQLINHYSNLYLKELGYVL